MKNLQMLKDKLKNKRGFTLVEMIVVIVIIGILAAVLIGSLTGYIKKARTASRKAELGTILTACQAYCTENYNGNSITLNSESEAAPLQTYVEDAIGKKTYTIRRCNSDAKGNISMIIVYVPGSGVAMYTPSAGWGGVGLN